MKRFLLFIFYCFSLQFSFAQIEFRNSNLGRVMNLRDLDGNALLKKYDPDINGSPFINDNWVSSIITLSSGKQIGPVSVKLNIESSELYYLDSAGKEMVAQDGSVRKIDCLDYYAKDSIRYVFKNGYPPIDKQDENFYYQVFTEGKIELLAKKFKYIRSEKNDLTGEISKAFIDGAVVLYVDAYGLMQPYRPTKEFVTSLFEQDKEQATKAFIETNKINLKKVPDLIKLFNYYNNSM